jgi:hypothetical protein
LLKDIVNPALLRFILACFFPEGRGGGFAERVKGRANNLFKNCG